MLCTNPIAGLRPPPEIPPLTRIIVNRVSPMDLAATTWSLVRLSNLKARMTLVKMKVQANSAKKV